MFNIGGGHINNLRLAHHILSLDEGPPVTHKQPFILIICLPKMY